MKGDIIEIRFGNHVCVLRKGSPEREVVLAGYDCIESPGDGEILGFYFIWRNWGNPELFA